MSTSEQLTVLTVDDNPLMGEALAAICTNAQLGMHVHSHFLSGEGVVEAVEALRPDVVVMDLDMPGTDTFALVREITQISPDTHVLMLSGHLKGDDILACLDAGASGYIHKDQTPAFIRDAVRRTALGEFVLCTDAARAAQLM